ncbi:MAG TPA: K+/H+ antiporter subunit F [Stellaceae bacterium]|jgi:multicomponent K+:H+ antiporter subunit F|nr:K+/H+ antiporter subunit F [Stellaceae bacterium]
MIAVASAIALAAIAVAMLLNLYRLFRGPDAVDRVLALDTLVINLIGLIVLAGILYGTTMYFEAALLFAMVGFITTVSFCKFLLRGNVIE